MWTWASWWYIRAGTSHCHLSIEGLHLPTSIEVELLATPRQLQTGMVLSRILPACYSLLGQALGARDSSTPFLLCLMRHSCSSPSNCQPLSRPRRHTVCSPVPSICCNNALTSLGQLTSNLSRSRISRTSSEAGSSASKCNHSRSSGYRVSPTRRLPGSVSSRNFFSASNDPNDGVRPNHWSCWLYTAGGSSIESFSRPAPQDLRTLP